MRPAKHADLEALARLRRENARTHANLAADRHRVPDAAPVRRYFEAVLDGSERGVHVLVADAGGEVVGMSELVVNPHPQDIR